MADTTPAPGAPEKLLTVRDVARILGISRESVFALLRTGQLGSVLIGQRGRRVTPAQLAAYIHRLERARPGGGGGGPPRWP